MVAPLFDVPFDSKSEWQVFMLEHALQHGDIYAGIVAKGKNMTIFPLIDATEPNDHDWLNNHQLEHQEIYDILGLSGLPDLSSADLSKQDQWQTWHDQHRDVHSLINSVLGI